MRVGGIVAGVLLLALGGSASAQSVFTANVREADQALGSYAFAHEFGSGIYRFGGRSIQVYRLPLALDLRAAGPARPGLRLMLPVTVGFVDFRTADVIGSELPEQIDALSFVPGLEWTWGLGRNWTAGPWAKVGASIAGETDVNALLAGAGLRAEYQSVDGGLRRRFRTEINGSRVAFRGLPDDEFLRLRNAFLLGRQFGRSVRGSRAEAGGYAIVDVFVDPPTGPTAGVDLPRVQIELGVALDTWPRWRAGPVPVPGLGFGWRLAGDLSGPRIVFGAPF